jgi:fluoroacetyl-CoA thioesterase
MYINSIEKRLVMMNLVEKGARYTSIIKVDEQHTAIAMGSGDMPVLATPAMMALMENAAMMAVSSCLPDDETTVGSQMDVSHLRPSAVGTEITATAVLTEVDGRKLTFEVKAMEGGDVIGKGVHIRYVVNRDAFLQKMNRQ